MGHVQASETVDAPTEDLFHFSDWCYNDPIWAKSVRKAWIKTLPGPDGKGMVSHYAGNIMGRDAEWEGESVQWVANESWTRKATTGLPAKMRFEIRMKFLQVGAGRTQVSSEIGYRVPYPIVGLFLDRVYVRRKAHEMARNAVAGLKKAASEGRIPSLEDQLLKRQADHPGYKPP